MKTKSINSGLKFLVVLTMMPASFTPAAGSAQAKPATGKCLAKEPCKTAYGTWQVQQGLVGATAAAPASGAEQAGARMNSAGMQTAEVACPAKMACVKAEKEAKSDANCSEDDKRSIASMLSQSAQGCDGAAAAALGGSQTQAAAGASGSGGDGNMMGALMGAALGAGLAAMMMKPKKNSGGADAAALAAQQQQYNGALRANGSIDCSMPDALAFRACDDQLAIKCGTIMDDPACQNFSARYCGPTSGAAATIMVQPQSPPGVLLGVDPTTLYGAVGEGLDTEYCRGVTGWNYCKTGGRTLCPSCLRIQRNQSAECAQNPALCLAQNSPAEIEKAKKICPTDPAFADPSFIAGGAAQLPSQLGVEELPAVVLPQSVGARPMGTNSASVGGISTMSANGGLQTAHGDGTREGYAAAGVIGAAVPGGGGGSVSIPGGSASVEPGGRREMASAAGGDFRPASVVAGPVSDVESQFGPSLFNTSSQVIRRRCQAGRLNNCP